MLRLGSYTKEFCWQCSLDLDFKFMLADPKLIIENPQLMLVGVVTALIGAHGQIPILHQEVLF